MFVEALSALGFEYVAKQGVAINTQLATGASTSLLPGVAVAMSILINGYFLRKTSSAYQTYKLVW